MAAISSNDIKNGITIKVDEGLFTVIDFQHVKPGKGGAFVRTKLRNARSGAVIERTYRSDERLEQAMIDQVPVSSKTLGDAANFLKETGKAMLMLHDEEIIGIELPASVELEIAETEPGIQGDRVSGARKSATLETGFVVQVPLFIGPGEMVKIDTRTGDYITRA